MHVQHSMIRARDFSRLHTHRRVVAEPHLDRLRGSENAREVGAQVVHRLRLEFRFREEEALDAAGGDVLQRQRGELVVSEDVRRDVAPVAAVARRARAVRVEPPVHQARERPALGVQREGFEAELLALEPVG
jgi:hypothetical protein